MGNVFGDINSETVSQGQMRREMKGFLVLPLFARSACLVNIVAVFLLSENLLSLSLSFFLSLLLPVSVSL